MTYRDPQYVFGKILTFLPNTISIQRTSRIFHTSYALSKWPHLHRAYIISRCIFFWLAVLTGIMTIRQKMWILYRLSIFYPIPVAQALSKSQGIVIWNLNYRKKGNWCKKTHCFSSFTIHLFFSSTIHYTYFIIK